MPAGFAVVFAAAPAGEAASQRRPDAFCEGTSSALVRRMTPLSAPRRTHAVRHLVPQMHRRVRTPWPPCVGAARVAASAARAIGSRAAMRLHQHQIPAGHASASRHARIATYSTVHGPMPGIASSAARKASASARIAVERHARPMRPRAQSLATPRRACRACRSAPYPLRRARRVWESATRCARADDPRCAGRPAAQGAR